MGDTILVEVTEEDAVAVADNIQAAFSSADLFSFDISDVLGGSDQLAAEVEFERGLSDSAVVSDSLGKAVDKLAGQDAAVALDTITAGVVMDRTAGADTAVVSDSLGFRRYDNPETSTTKLDADSDLSSTLAAD